MQLPLACYGVRDWAKRNDEAKLFTEANQKESADAMAPLDQKSFGSMPVGLKFDGRMVWVLG